MNKEKYLARFGYTGPLELNLETLAGLQLAHLLAVPFENLDIHGGPPLHLDPEGQYDKIVERRRGGICYELNGLFGWLLQALGFEVVFLSAQVHGADGKPGPAFDHMALQVTLDGSRYLVDVGFGDSYMQPLRIGSTDTHRQGKDVYHLQPEGENLLLMRATDSSEVAAPKPRPVFLLSLQPQPLAAFEAMCRFHQSSPASHFSRKIICSKAIPGGRISLSDHILITTEGSRRRTQRLATEADQARALIQYFGVVR